MKKYWFFGLSIYEFVDEDKLTNIQKEIIEQEKKEFLKKPEKNGWLGVSDKRGGWYFLRHGFEVAHIENISDSKLAREYFYEKCLKYKSPI